MEATGTKFVDRMSTECWQAVVRSGGMSQAQDPATEMATVMEDAGVIESRKRESHANRKLQPQQNAEVIESRKRETHANRKNSNPSKPQK